MLPRAGSSKSLGLFSTPVSLVSFMTRYAIRTKYDKILDPAVGDGIFLIEAYKRLLQLGAEPRKIKDQLFGVELDKESYTRSINNLYYLSGHNSFKIFNENFLNIQPRDSASNDCLIPRIDLLIANPPFLRYHYIKKRTRAKIRDKEISIELKGLFNLWAAFLVHAIDFLTDSGSLFVILPRTIFFADYAEGIRKKLPSIFRSVKIFLLDEKMFNGTDERIVLLFADKNNGKPGITVTRLNVIETKNHEISYSERKLVKYTFDFQYDGKWSFFKLNNTESSFLQSVMKKVKCSKLEDKAKIRIGTVTGNNAFFILSKEEVGEWNIGMKYLKPIVAKAKQIRGITFEKHEWEDLYEDNEKCFLLSLDGGKIANGNVNKYLEFGRSIGIDNGYKASNREPWYMVTCQESPHAFLTYMSHRAPRLVLNSAQVVCTNNIHCIYFNDHSKLKPYLCSFYNSLTLLSCELAGRSYGEGVLKLEPGECRKILLPDAPKSEKELTNKINQIDNLVRSKKIEECRQVIDEIVLEGENCLSKAAISKIGEIYKKVQRRRLGRL